MIITQGLPSWFIINKFKIFIHYFTRMIGGREWQLSPRKDHQNLQTVKAGNMPICRQLWLPSFLIIRNLKWYCNADTGLWSEGNEYRDFFCVGVYNHKKRSALNAFIILSYNVLHLYICCAHGLNKTNKWFAEIICVFFFKWIHLLIKWYSRLQIYGCQCIINFKVHWFSIKKN